MTHGSRTLIGLAGERGAGKDTMAFVLTERGFENVKFAGALKGMVALLLRYQGCSEDIIDRMVEGDLKEVPSDLLAGKTPRWAMQSIGTEWGRDLLGESLWADAAFNRVALFDKVVITDVRFPNECTGVQSRGGKVIRIEQPQTVGRKSTDTHPSEALIAQLPVDAVFVNDKSLGVQRSREKFAFFLADCEKRWAEETVA